MQIPFFNKTNSANRYLGLFLKEDEGLGLIIEQTSKGMIIRAKERFVYSDGWEHLTEDLDDVLFKLEKSEKKRLKETIFFLYSHTIEKESKEIKKPFLQKLKDVMKNLELKPIGYIECQTALAAYLEQKEQLPFTGILIEPDNTFVSVSIYKGGHLVFSDTTSRTDLVTDDIALILGTIKGTILLPSRIILYNSTNLADISTQIVSYRWSEDLFIQLPRVEVCAEHQILEAMLAMFQLQLKETKDVRMVPEKKEVMGFVIGGDVAEKKEEDQHPEPQLQHGQNKSFRKMIGSYLITIKSKLQFFHIRPLNIHIKGAKYGLIIIGLFLIIGALVLGELFIHKAEVTVLFDASLLQKDVDLTASTDVVNNENLLLHTGTISAALTKTISTTGKKQIGEKAVGEVTLHNFDDKEHTFPKGTVLSIAGIKFDLDDTVKIASASLTSLPDGSSLVKLPGKTKAKVTAEAIGTAGNVAKNQRFTITDFPSGTYFGINELAFSGGTQKDIRTVSANDLNDLKTQILEVGKQELQKNLVEKNLGDLRPIDLLTEYKLTNNIYSKEINDEASSVSLTSDVIAQYYSYSMPDLITYVRSKILEGSIPKGYVVPDSNIEVNVKDAKQKKNGVALSLQIEAKAVKKIDLSDLLSKIRGRQTKNVESMIMNQYKAKGVKILIHPSIPIVSLWLPLKEKNIDIRIVSQ